MDRRKALAGAGAVSLTLTAAAVAVGASFGLFGIAEAEGPVGSFSPVETTTPTRTVVIDVPATPGTTPAAGSGRSQSPGGVESTPTTTSVVPAPAGNSVPRESSGSGDDHGSEHGSDDHSNEVEHEVDDD